MLFGRGIISYICLIKNSDCITFRHPIFSISCVKVLASQFWFSKPHSIYNFIKATAVDTLPMGHANSGWLIGFLTLDFRKSIAFILLMIESIVQTF